MLTQEMKAPKGSHCWMKNIKNYFTHIKFCSYDARPYGLSWNYWQNPHGFLKLIFYPISIGGSMRKKDWFKEEENGRGMRADMDGFVESAILNVRTEGVSWWKPFSPVIFTIYEDKKSHWDQKAELHFKTITFFFYIFP